MQSPTKLKRLSSTQAHIPDTFVTFEIYKYVPWGRAIFVCGNLPKLGNWNPAVALRLRWNSQNKWVGEIAIPKDIYSFVEFKFIISQWDITPSSYTEWEDGINRAINPKSLQLQSYYKTEWNRQNFTLCLRDHSKHRQNSVFYVTGSIGELGAWKQKKGMQPIDAGLKKRVEQLVPEELESLNETEISNFLVYSFSVEKYIKSFNYYYYRWGEIVESESFPGRMIQLDNKSLVEEGRIAELQYLDHRIVIDESCFDDFMLHKITNQLYLASYLQNSLQFYKITEKHITALLHLENKYQPFSITSSRIKSLCKENGVLFKHWILENIKNLKFIDEIREIISIVEGLVIQGHRVCVHCSGQILRDAPIKILYLTLMGYPFKQAVEQVSKEMAVSENNCKMADGVLQLISQKNRGKFNFYINSSV